MSVTKPEWIDRQQTVRGREHGFVEPISARSDSADRWIEGNRWAPAPEGSADDVEREAGMLDQTFDQATPERRSRREEAGGDL